MNSKVLYLAVLSTAVASGVANSFEIKGQPNLYGEANFNAGYQMVINSYAVEADNEDYKKTNHYLALGTGFNLYYKGFSDKFNPFIGARFQVNIPLYNVVRKDVVSKNLLYNILEGGVIGGLRIKLNKDLMIEPFMGYGKVLTVETSRLVKNNKLFNTDTYVVDQYSCGVKFLVKEKYSVSVEYKINNYGRDIIPNHNLGFMFGYNIK